MHTQDKSPLDTAMMDAYRRQMMEMYRQSTPSPLSETAEDNWLDNRYPEPNINLDKAAMAPPSATQPEPQTAPVPPPSDFVGYLRAYTFTGNGAEPIAGARVVVTRPDGDGQTVYANLTTDADGFTPVIALPSVDPALTLRPGDIQPYVTYTIRITADGFRPVEHRNIPIYGNNYVTQPVAMTPILPGANATDTQAFTSGGPTNL